MAADDEKASILAALVSKSQDEDVKNVLRLYDLAQPTSVLKKKLASADKGKLLKTATYLQAWEFSSDPLVSSWRTLAFSVIARDFRVSHILS